MSKNPFLKSLSQGPIIADGSLESQLRKITKKGSCLEELVLLNPREVQKAHLSYITSGAEIIRTNSYAANKATLKKFGLEKKTYKINLNSAKLAKNVRDISGRSIFIAGNIGGDTDKEQIEALLEGGVDLFLLNLAEEISPLESGVSSIKNICDFPIVVVLNLTPKTKKNRIDEFVKLAILKEIDILGFSTESLKQTKEIIALSRDLPQPPRALFLSQEALKGFRAEKFPPHILILGGGENTTPEEIKKIKNFFSPRKEISEFSVSFKLNPSSEIPAKKFPTQLAEKVAKGEFFISVEIDPPKGASPQKDIEGAFMLKEQNVDFINVGDSPMARIRMDAKDFCLLIQNIVGLETILHFTTRDRNLMKIQADLLGAHVLGIRNIIALTGDPIKSGNCPEASSVYDINSTQLVDLIKNKLNKGVDWYDNPLGGPTSLFVAAALDLNAKGNDPKWRFLEEKIKMGADIAMTQPIFESEPLLRYLDRVQGKPPIPLVLGILPLQSERHALFLNNNVAGIHVPDKIRERLKKAGSQAKYEGIVQAQELIMEVRAHIAGIYIIPSFGRYEIAAEVAKGV